MNELKCLTCGGVYFSTNTDGTEYYHACAPVVNKLGITTEIPEKRDENIGVEQQGKGIQILG